MVRFIAASRYNMSQTSNLNVGETKVVQEGVAGQTKHSNHYVENGVEVDQWQQELRQLLRIVRYMLLLQNF